MVIRMVLRVMVIKSIRIIRKIQALTPTHHYFQARKVCTMIHMEDTMITAQMDLKHQRISLHMVNVSDQPTSREMDRASLIIVVGLVKIL